MNPAFTTPQSKGFPPLFYRWYRVQETLRYPPNVYHLCRAASKDDVIPLAYPVYTTSGTSIFEIPAKLVGIF